MTSVVLGIGVAALILATIALVVGGLSLAFVVGLKNSTHNVVWKDVAPNTLGGSGEEAEEESEDPFVYSPEENPNKKIKAKTIENDEEDFADLSDPSVTSNDWR